MIHRLRNVELLLHSHAMKHFIFHSIDYRAIDDWFNELVERFRLWRAVVWLRRASSSFLTIRNCCGHGGEIVNWRGHDLIGQWNIRHSESWYSSCNFGEPTDTWWIALQVVDVSSDRRVSIVLSPAWTAIIMASSCSLCVCSIMETDESHRMFHRSNQLLCQANGGKSSSLLHLLCLCLSVS